jgi:23S rRNA (cytidine1920-2'-O)/16S rRNA (cytidine1409-2'-O)-methyltransferase
LRLDLFLVESKLAASRTQAQDFIKNGFVYLKNKNENIKLVKASFIVDETNSANIYVEDNLLQKYVSRAGLKLESAIKAISIEVKGKNVLDIGQSKGGFTDCLLQHGAKHVVGIDVGHQQLHSSLAGRKDIDVIENLNVKELATSPQFIAAVPPNKFDLVVVDVSFISLAKIISFLVPYLKNQAEYVLLVKPQFECGKENLDKNGIVKNPRVYASIEENIRKICIENFNNVEAYIKSDIMGKDGNQEFFIYGKNCN